MTGCEALARSAEELRQRIEEHHALLKRVMEESDSVAVVDVCLVVECPHRRKLREVLTEVIEVLEETRRAFKSKRLEALRKKLVRVLAEDA